MTDDILFSATAHGRRVTIGLATDAELVAIARPILAAEAQDVLLPSMLVSIRIADDPATSVHALGWRLKLANTWLTTRLLAVDLGCGDVGTSSGKIYRMVGWKERVSSPLLHRHLGEVLRHWGLRNVTAA